MDCGSTATKFDERNSGSFKIYEIVGGTQHGKCLDAYIEGSYPCDGTDEQDWLKTGVGGGWYRLQDQYYNEYLDDGCWDTCLDMDPLNTWCDGCQHWKFE